MFFPKYEFSDETMTTEYGITLHRIRALKAIRLENREVRPGELGGWLESEANLSHFGRCWVEKNAAVLVLPMCSKMP